jgi:ribosome-binding ATPase YchF (GTP1/OBG family)
MIKKAYELLGLISYFTTGVEETRAWTIKINTKAPQAAAAIHNDFEKKFIRAQVINWEKFVALGSKAAAKEKGMLRMEGKDYVVVDGDTIEFFI